MSDTDPETPQVKALFAIDAREPADVFEGWYDPDAQPENGWVMPAFDPATALKIIAWLDAGDYDDTDIRPMFSWDGAVLVLNEADSGVELLQRIEPDPHGRYPIGAGSWVWDVIELPDGEELGPWLRRVDEEAAVQRDVANLILDRANDAGHPVRDLNRLRQIAGDRAVSELRSLRPNDPHAPLPSDTINLLTPPGHTPTPTERDRFT